MRVFLTTAAAREFAARSSKVISAGRQPCPLCSEPLDPEGHLCIRTNGYKRDAELSKSLDFIDPEVFNSLAAQSDPGLTADEEPFDQAGDAPQPGDPDEPDEPGDTGPSARD